MHLLFLPIFVSTFIICDGNNIISSDCVLIRTEIGCDEYTNICEWDTDELQCKFKYQDNDIVGARNIDLVFVADPKNIYIANDLSLFLSSSIEKLYDRYDDKSSVDLRCAIIPYQNELISCSKLLETAFITDLFHHFDDKNKNIDLLSNFEAAVDLLLATNTENDRDRDQYVIVNFDDNTHHHLASNLCKDLKELSLFRIYPLFIQWKTSKDDINFDRNCPFSVYQSQFMHKINKYDMNISIADESFIVASKIHRNSVNPARFTSINTECVPYKLAAQAYATRGDEIWFISGIVDIPTPKPTTDPTITPSIDPTVDPTADPTTDPTESPTTDPTRSPTTDPTKSPSTDPTYSPTTDPTESPSIDPTKSPSTDPTYSPTTDPTSDPTESPTTDPTKSPSTDPTYSPSTDPTKSPTTDPTESPSTDPTKWPSTDPTYSPTTDPTSDPTESPTSNPTALPTAFPTTNPTGTPTKWPTMKPTASPSFDPSKWATVKPTASPSSKPTKWPTISPTSWRTSSPTKSSDIGSKSNDRRRLQGSCSGGTGSYNGWVACNSMSTEETIIINAASTDNTDQSVSNGYSSESYLSMIGSLDIYNIESGDVFKNNILMNNYRGCVIGDGNDLYFFQIGGYDINTKYSTNYLQIFDIKQMSWYHHQYGSMPNMNIPRYLHSCILEKDTFYVFGGIYNAQNINDVDSYYDSIEYFNFNPMGYTNMSMSELLCLNEYDTNNCYIGGVGDKEDEPKWEMACSYIQYPRISAKVLKISKNKMFLIGGYGYNDKMRKNGALQSIEIYDMNDNKILYHEMAPRLIVARAAFTVGIYDDDDGYRCLHIIGGKSHFGDNFNKLSLLRSCEKMCFPTKIIDHYIHDMFELFYNDKEKKYRSLLIKK